MTDSLAFLIVAPVVFLCACSSPPRPREEISDPGELLFNGYIRAGIECYSCHAGDGSGSWIGANLIGIGEREDREEIIEAIRSGPGIMPSYDDDDLTDEELGELADWLVTLK